MKRRTFLLGTAFALAAPAIAQGAFIAAEVPKHVALLKKAGFEAQ